ncbi:hypothetical protein JCM10213_003887 [Rhodosporidiobolus nylandii]
MNQGTKSTVRSAAGARPDYCELSSEDSDDEMVEVGAKSMSGGKSSRGRGGRGKAGDEGGSSDDGEWTAKKRRKTRAKGKGKAKKQKKKADLLQTMPLDILVEIFAYLHPGELLNLSRTAKPYNTLLTSKSSAPMWRKARHCVNLPDVNIEHFSEIRYAQLCFDKPCEVCGGSSRVSCDFYLLRRFCEPCRKEHYIRIDNLELSDPRLHPRVGQVVVSTHCTHPRRQHVELDQDLFELENEDDGDIEVRKLKVSTRTRSRGGNGVADYVTRVEAFVSGRQAVVEGRKKDAEAMDTAHWKAINAIDGEKRRLRRAEKRVKRLLRGQEVEEDDDWTDTGAYVGWSHFRYQLQLRLEREENFPRQAFYSPTWLHSRAVRGSGGALTDEAYEAIKPKALEIARRALEEYDARCEADQAKEEKALKLEQEWQRQQTRLEHIGERLDGLLLETDLFTTLATPILPVLLTFESVKPLLLPPGSSDETPTDLADEIWDDALPLLEEELAQYRLDLLLHAIKLVLSATSGDPLPEDDDILEHLDEYDDAFFNKATSFLCCSFPGCHTYGEWNWNRSIAESVRTPGHTLFTGPFHALLAHQHAAHSSEFSRLKKLKEADKLTPQIFIDLPLEVACAVTALIEVGNLDDETAGVEELDEMDQRGRYEWENTRIWAKRFSGWRELLDAIYRAATKAARAGPEHFLPPPCIVYYPDGNRAAMPDNSLPPSSATSNLEAEYDGATSRSSGGGDVHVKSESEGESEDE